MSEENSLQDLLRQEHDQGQWESSGAFTIDAARARIKLSRHQLGPGMYLAKLVQAGVAAGCRCVEVTPNPRGLASDAGLLVRYLGPDLRQLSLDLLAKGLEEPLSLGSGTPASHLCAGILASQHPHPRQVRCSLREGSQVVRLTIEDGLVRCERGTCPPSQATAELRLEGFGYQELDVVRHRFGYAPVPIVLDEVRLESRWGQEARDDWGACYRLAEHYSLQEGGLHLGVPAPRAAWTVGGGEPQAGPRPTSVHLAVVEGDLPPSKPWTCESALALPARPISRGEEGRLILVQHGMTLRETRFAWPLPGMLGVASAQGLKTDLSGHLVEDEAYQDLVSRLLERARELLRELSRHLDDLELPYRGRGATEAGVQAVGAGAGLCLLSLLMPELGPLLVLGGAAAATLGGALAFLQHHCQCDRAATQEMRRELKARLSAIDA